MTIPLRLAHLGVLPATPAATAVPTYRVNPAVRVALYLYVFSIPFEMPHRSIPIEIPTLVGFIFLAVALLQPSVAFRRIPAALVWFAVHLWILAVAAAITSADHVAMVFQHLVTIAQVMLLTWVIANLLGDARVLRGALLSIVIACTVRAAVQVLGIARTARAVWGGGERVTAFGQNANMSALILASGLIVIIGLAVARDQRLPRFGVFVWPLGAVIAVAMIQSGSRGGLFSAAAGLVALCLAGRTPWQRLRNVLLSVLAVVALTWAAGRSEVVRHRFDDARVQGNLAGRERIYPAALAMVRERPWFGWGPIENQYEIGHRIKERIRERRDAHNLALELLTTTGVIGAVPFLIGLGLCIRHAWRARRGPLGMLPFALVIAVLTGTISGTWLVAKILWLALALAIAAGTYWRDDPAPPGKAQPCAA